MEFPNGEGGVSDAGGEKGAPDGGQQPRGLNSFESGRLVLLFVTGTHGLYPRLNILLGCLVCTVLGVFCAEGPLALRTGFRMESGSPGMVS